MGSFLFDADGTGGFDTGGRVFHRDGDTPRFECLEEAVLVHRNHPIVAAGKDQLGVGGIIGMDIGLKLLLLPDIQGE